MIRYIWSPEPKIARVRSTPSSAPVLPRTLSRPRDRSLSDATIEKARAKAWRESGGKPSSYAIRDAFRHLRHLEGLARVGALSARDAEDRLALRRLLLGKRSPGSGKASSFYPYFEIPF